MNIRFLVSIAAVVAIFSAPAKAIECDGCTQEEHTTLLLQQFLTVSRLVNEISTESDQIDEETLRFYLSRYGTILEVNALLGDNNVVKPESTAASTKKSAPVDRPSKPKSRTAKKKSPRGTAGLLVAHAQTARDDIGFSASAILSSNGKSIPLPLGGTFKHNNTLFELVEVSKVNNADGSVGHLVYVKNKSTGKRKSLPWNLLVN